MSDELCSAFELNSEAEVHNLQMINCDTDVTMLAHCIKEISLQYIFKNSIRALRNINI